MGDEDQVLIDDGNAGGRVRRRNNADRGDDDGRGSPTRRAPSWASRVQTADMFGKIDSTQLDDVAFRTTAGGIVSVVCYFLMFVLFVSETSRFLFSNRYEHLKVDTSRSQMTEIYFHITFPAICCADVHVDTMDVTGEQQVNVVQSIWKTRLDMFGNAIGREFIDKDLSPKLYIQMPGIGLMSLVGTDHRIAEQRAGHEGCIVRGTLIVNKVEGNFHVAVGRSHKSQGHHVHNFRMSDLPHFNTSHTIHAMSFGPRYSGQPESPLNGWTRTIEPSSNPDAIVSGLFQYHIELTPTTFKSMLGRQLHTNQVSVNDYFKRLDFTGSASVSGMPGVFFQYKFSPFMVAIDDRRTSIVEYFTSTFAIIGGVFAVSTMIDGLIYRLSRPMRPYRSSPLLS
ncbi:Endoplasmic reticulum vesicle transporter C-terminal domain-containing protein [Plasmodiophora brassicae]|uniref:Endoplasmic reticulum vesicle transporter C-terminal domain-containing protein n=1 Tax=Plasmodiophora brassicae TaxID=37360 RepID=A0A3P3Y7C8_PLABS|nr:unnamed protein product [Plasmodiophora brassicae]